MILFRRLIWNNHKSGSRSRRFPRLKSFWAQTAIKKWGWWLQRLSINPDLLGKVEGMPCFITSSLTQLRISGLSKRFVTLSVMMMHALLACHQTRHAVIDVFRSEITFNNLTRVFLSLNRAVYTPSQHCVELRGEVNTVSVPFAPTDREIRSLLYTAQELDLPIDLS